MLNESQARRVEGHGLGLKIRDEDENRRCCERGEVEDNVVGSLDAAWCPRRAGLKAGANNLRPLKGRRRTPLIAVVPADANEVRSPSASRNPRTAPLVGRHGQRRSLARRRISTAPRQVLTLLPLILLLATACSLPAADTATPTGANPGSVTLSIVMNEMYFKPDRLQVPLGSQVTIKLKNEGAVLHDFTIDNVNGQKVQEKVPGGKSGELTFTAPSQPATLTFYCSQPGHRAAGMQGTLVVK